MQWIGDIFEGGYVFKMMEVTVLVADLDDIGVMDWYDAIDTVEVYTASGYSDWYLPNKDELILLYNTLGQDSENIFGFNIAGGTTSWYWSSTEQNSSTTYGTQFSNGNSWGVGKDSERSIRVIRSICVNDLNADGVCDIIGCMDETACNFDDLATLDNGSCANFDECGVCNGDNSSCTDECGVINGDNSSCTDECGIINGDNSSCTDECGVINGDNSSCTDECGIINGDNSSCTDECGIINGNNSSCTDECGVVNGDNSSCSFLNLPEGWSMFGYTCLESLSVFEAFSDDSDKIEIVKDELGLSYLPSWGFSAFDSLEYGEGYQIKMIEEVLFFRFCEEITPEDGIGQVDVDNAYANGYSAGAASVTPEDGVSQEDVDAAHAMYEGWCESDIDNDGICDIDEVWGCMDTNSCNYNLEAEFDNGTCEYDSCADDCGVVNGDNSSCADECGVPNGDNSTCADECGVPNGDNSSCTDCEGIINGTSEDLGCGCGNPARIVTYDCDGNLIGLLVGDHYAGGIVFDVNVDLWSGKVANYEDLEGTYEWDEALNAAENANAQGYDDWYLPSLDELLLVYNTIGPGGTEAMYSVSGKPGGNLFYKSSTEYNGGVADSNGNIRAWVVNFNNGSTGAHNQSVLQRVRIIRSF